MQQAGTTTSCSTTAMRALENSRVENGMLAITARREDLSTAGLAGLERPALLLGAPHHARQGDLDLRLLRSARQTTLRRRHLAGDLDVVDPAADALARRWRDRHHGARGLRSRRRACHRAHRRVQPHARQPSHRHHHDPGRLQRSSIATRCTGRPRASPWAWTTATTTSTRTTAPAMPSGRSTVRSS